MDILVHLGIGCFLALVSMFGIAYDLVYNEVRLYTDIFRLKVLNI